MTIRLLITETRPAYFKLWLDAFHDISTVTVIKEPVSSSKGWENGDAEIMRGIFAHERYGGRPKPGVSQILSTHGDTDMPPRVVTTAPFPGRVETERQADGTLRAKVVSSETRAPEKEEYIAFSKVFDEIGRFNTTNPETPIKLIVFSPEFLGLPRQDVKAEIEAIKNAYLDHINSSELFD